MNDEETAALTAKVEALTNLVTAMAQVMTYDAELSPLLHSALSHYASDRGAHPAAQKIYETAMTAFGSIADPKSS